MSQQMDDTAEMPPVGPTLVPPPAYGLGQALGEAPPYVPQTVPAWDQNGAWPVMRMPEPSRLSRLLARRRDRGPVTWPMVVQTAIRWAGGIGIVGLLAWAGQK